MRRQLPAGQGLPLPGYYASSLFITLIGFYMTPATAANKFCQ
ncbi:hypothetical protein CKO_02138 [Citrobacter koseri ATCC BAA-895]|uniref:Uncharacterized protein n=1 Tax=Citrobacter koseri (strain ATCC BAA-895 / CDC 4225-83 / SGSC4696) TaxID=290338 RepID=A8AIE8_CITK8|nr:hypothetical protein CKO_02138 [Citrobacter koseri ATCC BAA-895]